MKRLVLMALLLTAWVVPAAAHDVKKTRVIYSSDLVERGGLFYEKFSNTPFTGKTRGMFRGSERPYKNERLHGVVKVFTRTGKLRVLETYKEGEAHGKSPWFHENGQLHADITYKSGKSNGPYVRWWPNGQLREKGVRKASTREGRWEYRNEDGTLNLDLTGTYHNDFRIGP